MMHEFLFMPQSTTIAFTFGELKLGRHIRRQFAAGVRGESGYQRSIGNNSRGSALGVLGESWQLSVSLNILEEMRIH